MEITINGADAGIILENEKTVGDVVAGVSDWLAGSGLVIDALEIDGRDVCAELEGAFKTGLDKTGAINIKTCAQAELCIEALAGADRMVKEGRFREWEAGPSASFLRDREPELYRIAEDTFAGKTENRLEALMEERREELFNPAGEFLRIEDDVKAMVARLTDLALDVQMGKDARAAQTVQLFAGLSLKILRLIPLLRLAGIEFEDIKPGENFFESLHTALKDFLDAYKASDTVLSGDLAEYEIAPRLEELYSALKNSGLSDSSPGGSKPENGNRK